VDYLNERLTILAEQLRGLVNDARRVLNCPLVIEEDDVLYTSLMPVEKATRGIPTASTSWKRISAFIIRRRCIDLMRAWTHRDEGEYLSRRSEHSKRCHQRVRERWDPVAAAERDDEIEYLSQRVGLNPDFKALLEEAALSGHFLTSTEAAQRGGSSIGAARTSLLRLRKVARRRYGLPERARGCA